MTADKSEPRTERTVRPPNEDPGAQAVDDHVAGDAPRGGTQPTDHLPPTVDAEHLRSPSQGVRPEETPNA